MASNLERLARDKGLKGDTFKSVRATLMAQAAQIRALKGPEHINIEKTTQGVSSREQAPHVEFDLDAEWQRQGQNLLRLNFHTERGFDDTEEGRQSYLDTLAKFEPQPESYQGRLDKPVIVEKQIPWTRQRELAEINLSDYFASRLDETHPWEGNHNTVVDGVTSYTGWFNKWGEGDFQKPIGPFSARNKLAQDTVGADMYEAVAQQIHFPVDNENGRYFDVIGVRVESGSIPYLYRWGGRPEFNAYWNDYAGSDFRPLVRGSEIKVVTG